MSNKYLMSSAQKRIFTIEKLQKNSITYNVPLIFEVDGYIARERLAYAFSELCNRHEVFRTRFVVEKEEFLQIVENEASTELKYDRADKKENKELMRRFIRPFDLEQAPLIRMGLICNAENKFMLMIDVHHIVFDGASMAALLSDLNALYSGETLSELEIQYKDFAAWHNSIDFGSQLEFWKEELKSLAGIEAGFPIDYSRKKVQTYDGARLISDMKEEAVSLVSQICMQYEVTEFMVFISAVMILAMKYNDQTKSVIGTVVDGRNHPQAYDMIGMFVNSLLVRTEIQKEDTFGSFLNNVKNKCFDVFENQDLPYEQLVEMADPVGSVSQNPLFGIMFSYEVEPEELTLFEGCTLVLKPVYLDIAKFDLTLSVMKKEIGFVFDWEYNTGLYSPETMELINEHFQVLLQNLLKSPDKLILDISYINQEERKRILEDFSQSVNLSPVEANIIEVFEMQAAKNPNRKALVLGTEQMTYSELGDSANYVGTQLRALGLKPNDIVALITGRSFEMIIGMLGVLKAGAAYLPIDPKCPVERIAYMLKDSKAKAVLLYQGEVDRNSLLELPVLELSRHKKQPQNLPIVNSSKDLAYIIYTSGTTGMPKGVMLEQGGLMNLMKWQIREASINDHSVVLQKSTYIFDASVWECFLALLTGSTLQLLDEKENNDFNLLIDIIRKNKVTHTLMIPTVFDALLDYMLEEGMRHGLDSLERIYLGAEAVTDELVSKYCEVTNQGKETLRNLYGPTEATVCATYYDLTQHMDKKIPIGAPIDNMQTYIINSAGLCGIGVIGEIYIGGAGVARGYVNNQELTSEKFKESPIQKGKRLYATGDLGRWNKSGYIEFCGRADDQIKIRGIRVELGEIETAIASMGDINRVVVLAKEVNKSQQLCAYFTAQTKMDVNELKSLLRNQLPEYMVPTYMIQIDKFPTTVNGKLDRELLPEPNLDHSRVYVAPQTEMEKILAETIKSSLKVSDVGMRDSFFELGGDSIKAIRIVSKLRERGYEVKASAILKSADLQELAKQMNLAKTDAVEQGEMIGSVLRTPIQSFFYNMHMEKPHHFNQSFLLESHEKVDGHMLNEALKAVIQHHDILRMVVKAGKQIIEPFHKFESFHMEVFQTYNRDEGGIVSELYRHGEKAQQEIDMENGPLIKALLFTTEEKDYIWLMIHHLVVDGVSWRIILEDLNHAYRNKICNQEISLPLKTTSYQEWSEKLQQFSKSYELSREAPYWKKTNRLIQENKKIEFDLGRARELFSSSIELTDSVTKVFIQEATRKYHAEVLEVFLAAVVRTFYRIYNMEAVAVNLESHGREEVIEAVKLDRSVGWFTSLYPVVIQNIGASPNNDVRIVKETLRRVPNHGIGYGILNTYTKSVPAKHADITVNYLGDMEPGQSEDTCFFLSRIENKGDVSKKNIFGSAISFNAIRICKSLHITANYYKPIFSDADIQKILRVLHEEIVLLTEHSQSMQGIMYTPSDYGELEWEDHEFSYALETVQLLHGQIEKIIPMAPMQEGILYHKMLDEDASSYVIQCSYKTDSHFLASAFQEALKLLSQKHGILRTIMMYRGVEEPRQVIMKAREIECNHVDLTLSQNPDLAWSQLEKNDVKRGFDLERDSLLRVSIVRYNEHETRIIFCFHHIIMDGWCLSLLLSDLNQFYGEIRRGRVANDLAAEIIKDNKYEQYIKLIQKKDKDQCLSYWHEVLNNYETLAGITPLRDYENSNSEIGVILDALSESDSQRLNEMSRQYNITVNSIIETAWGIVLQRYNHTNDVTFGKMVSGRNVKIEGIEKVIGLFINAIPVRVKASHTMPVVQLAKAVQNQALESEEYAYCPLAEVQGVSTLGKDLIQTIVAFENFDSAGEGANEIGLEALGYREETNYPISLSVGMSGTLDLKLMYASGTYHEYEAKLIIGRLKNVIVDIIENPEKTIADVQMMDDEEMKKVSIEFNDTAAEYNREKTIIDLFFEKVKQYPDKIAVRMDNELLTYEQLGRKSDYIAGLLLRKGVKENEIIGLMVKRSPEMVIGMLGVLKAGGAYVPIDPKLPADRIGYMIEDSDVHVILTDIQDSAVLKEHRCKSINIKQSENESPAHLRLPRINGNNHAYVIYTSGTTGRPKGVVVNHSSLANLCNWQADYLSISHTSKVLQQFAYVFDGSVFEIFIALLSGAQLEIVSDEVKGNAAAFLQKLPEATLITVPSLFKMLMDYAQEHNETAYIQQIESVGLAGEVLSPVIANQFFEITGSTPKLYNLYGPTETTVCATAYRVKPRKYNNVPIGGPIFNTQVFILQESTLCGVGIVGELCVAGESLAEAYRNKPELTQEKFVYCPYAENKRVYRSGDRGRWLTDGTIQYMGRVDEQVKIRGFRIEVGEIENCLLEVKEVKEAAVIAREIHGDLKLLGYISSQEEIEVEEIKGYLSNKLPGYMVPAYITVVKEIPRTHNGKVDKKALPDPEVVNTEKYVEPEGEMEKIIAEGFAQILKIEKVGRHDNFFDLGGHSLRATRLVNYLARTLNCAIPLSLVMKKQTVISIAEAVKALQTSQGVEKIEVAPEEEM